MFTMVSLSRCCTEKCPSREEEGVSLDPQWMRVRCLTSELLSRRAVFSGDVNQTVKRLAPRTGVEYDWMSLHLQSVRDDRLQGCGSWLQE